MLFAPSFHVIISYNFMDKKINLNDALKKLESIAAWFESRREVDVEEGLKKVKEGAVLAGDVKNRLREIENEFEEVKRGLSGMENEGGIPIGTIETEG